MDKSEKAGIEGDRPAGAALVGAGILIPLAMLHHPTHVSAALLTPIHGLLIALLLATACAFAHLALRLGIARPPVLCGALLYGVSLVANLLAATINGFVVPRLAEAGATGAFAALWAMNQALAELAVLTAGTALLLWGWAAARQGALWPRTLLVAGAALGALPALLLLFGAISMDVQGALVTYGAQALWGALAGAALLRRGTGAGAKA